VQERLYSCIARALSVLEVLSASAARRSAVGRKALQKRSS